MSSSVKKKRSIPSWFASPEKYENSKRKSQSASVTQVQGLNYDQLKGVRYIMDIEEIKKLSKKILNMKEEEKDEKG